jgi:hypothetical protein
MPSNLLTVFIGHSAGFVKKSFSMKKYNWKRTGFMTGMEQPGRDATDPGGNNSYIG